MTKKSPVLIGGVALAGLLLTGCTGFDDPGGNGGADRDASVTIALAAEPVSLDPCDSQDALNATVLRGNITESLTRIDADSGDVVAGLATEWEQIDDRTWLFELREGVQFHDGETFDAEAAALAIQRVQNPDLSCQNFDELPYELSTDIVDDHTLEVTSAEADPILPLRLTWVDVGSPAADPDTKTLEPVGTGPFVFVSRTQGESVVVERNEEYWGEPAQVERATYVFRVEPAVRAGMVSTGEADLAVPISVQEATDDDRTRPYNDNRVFFLRTHTDRAPFDDIRVRQAVAYAIDKDTIVGALMANAGTPYDQMIAPTVNAYLDDYTGPSYDPDQARALIAEAQSDGVAVDTEFDLVTRPDMFPGSDEVIQAIAQNLQDVGLTVNVLSLDTEAWLQLLRAPFPPDQKPTIVAASHDNITGDASFSFNSYVASTGPNSTIRNDEIDRLLSQAGSSTGEQRADLYQQAANVLYEDVAAIIPIAEQNKLVLLGDRVEYEPNGLTGVELRLSDIQLN